VITSLSHLVFWGAVHKLPMIARILERVATGFRRSTAQSDTVWHWGVYKIDCTAVAEKCDACSQKCLICLNINILRWSGQESKPRPSAPKEWPQVIDGFR
jgi:hypothetical protein